MQIKQYTKILGTYSAASMFAKYNFTQKEINTMFTKGRYDNECYYVWNTMIHEYMHHLQILGTSMGRHYAFLIGSSGYLLSDQLGHYIRNGYYSRLRRPLIFNYFYDKKFSDYLSVNRNMALSQGLIARLFFAKSQRSKDYKGFLNFIDKPKSYTLPNELESVPILKLKNRKYYLGAYLLFESFASMNERLSLMISLPKNKLIKAWSLIPNYPYQTIENYILKELNLSSFNFNLNRAIIDVALNPEIDNLDKPAKKWKDVHPGYRFLKIIEFLKSKSIKVDKKLNYDEILTLTSDIYKKLRWTNPWENLNSFDLPFTPFLSESIKIRKDNPIALILPVENLNLLSSIPMPNNEPSVPISADKNAILDAHPEFDPAAFHIFIQAALLMAENWANIIKMDYIECPLHSKSSPPNSKCIGGCEFEMALKAVTGLSFKKFSNIPKATMKDIQIYKSEIIRQS
jgi:hypothetical protein